MPTLAPSDIVGVWETAGALPGWGKALAMLAPLSPDEPPGALARLSVGERNARLLALRQGTFGPAMQAMVRCPRCGEPLEFEQRIDELLDDYAPPAAHEHHFASAGYGIRYRLLTSDDLRHAAAKPDAATARAALAARAVIEARFADRPVAGDELPEPVLLALADTMAASDPLAQIAITVACAACEHVWAADFEIVAFLWAEIERQARYILEDVVKLAHGYGWSEREILSMSTARRQYYLDALD